MKNIRANKSEENIIKHYAITNSRHLNFHLLMTSTFGIPSTEPPIKTTKSSNSKPNDHDTD